MFVISDCWGLFFFSQPKKMSFCKFFFINFLFILLFTGVAFYYAPDAFTTQSLDRTLNRVQSWFSRFEFEHDEVIDDPKRLSISVLILGDPKSIQSLFNSLDSYQKGGLFSVVKEVIVYLQELHTIDNQDLRRLATYPIDLVLGSVNNTYVHGAMWRMVDAATGDYILFLEKDFELAPNHHAEYQLMLAINAIRDNVVRVIRTKSRKMPGSPEFGRLHLGPGGDQKVFFPSANKSTAKDLACQLLYWHGDDSFRAMLQAYNITDVVHYGSSYQMWSFPAGRCHWTNQAPFFSRQWFTQNMHEAMRRLKPQLDNEYQRHHALEIAMRYETSGFQWASTDWSVGVGSGIFRHHDLEKYPYDTRIDNMTDVTECSR